jgi:phosphoribosylformimino-5-aminoimidazole carboxamide ribotide isomerase
MKIIPVIDILNGVVVHAVRGNREQYQPLQSVLCSCVDPVAVAGAFKDLGFKEVYVADLDAILGKAENFGVLQRVVEKTGLRLMVDAGVSTVDQAQRLLKAGVAKVVVGTETLPNLAELKQVMDAVGGEVVVVSLDLRNGKVLSPSQEAQTIEPLQLTMALEALGVSEVIVLDLARVGSGEGVDFQLLEQLKKEGNLNVLVGGGVRDLNDILDLKKLGVTGVLVASALHSGALSVEALKAAGLL